MEREPIPVKDKSVSPIVTFVVFGSEDITRELKNRSGINPVTLIEKGNLLPTGLNLGDRQCIILGLEVGKTPDGNVLLKTNKGNFEMRPKEIKPGDDDPLACLLEQEWTLVNPIIIQAILENGGLVTLAGKPEWVDLTNSLQVDRIN